MDVPSIYLNYRPVRIGWLVGERNLEFVVKAARESTYLWGGKYNPIIPAYDIDEAHRLIRIFGVDALRPIGGDTSEIFRYYDDELEYPTPASTPQYHSKRYDLASVIHPLQKFCDTDLNKNQTSVISWEKEDPLASLFTLEFGEYPDDSGGQKLYEQLQPDHHKIINDEPVSSDLILKINPIEFSGTHLTNKTRYPYKRKGMYIGDATDCDDLINFWNLRASGAALKFFDPKFSSRLREFIEQHHNLTIPISREDTAMTEVFSCDGKKKFDLNIEGISQTCSTAVNSELFDKYPWISLVYFNEKAIHLGNRVFSSDLGKSLTFDLPEKPVFRLEGEGYLHQFVVSLNFSTSDQVGGNYYCAPFLPKLNYFYRREFFHGCNGYARPKNTNKIDLITECTTEAIGVRPFSVAALWAEIFSFIARDYVISDAGHRCENLIKQFGGLNNCSILQIRGLRKLLNDYAAKKPFTRKKAIEKIIDCDLPSKNNISCCLLKQKSNIDNGSSSGSEYHRDFLGENCRSSFSSFKNSHTVNLGQETNEIEPGSVFDAVTKSRIFRVGLKLKCTRCYITEWIYIDDIKANHACNYCGNVFDVVRCLEDAPWHYKGTGVLGMGEEKLGSIPVAATLSKLKLLLSESILYSTSAKLKSRVRTDDINEIDFALIVSDRGSKPSEILIGECKSKSENIKKIDIDRMNKLASELNEKVCKTYIMFSKDRLKRNGNGFSEEEIKLIGSLNHSHHGRIIVWGSSELDADFDSNDFPQKDRYNSKVTLTDLAQRTQKLFS